MISGKEKDSGKDGYRDMRAIDETDSVSRTVGRFGVRGFEQTGF
jgi:hypothetical protein